MEDHDLVLVESPKHGKSVAGQHERHEQTTGTGKEETLNGIEPDAFHDSVTMTEFRKYRQDQAATSQKILDRLAGLETQILAATSDIRQHGRQSDMPCCVIG